MKYCSTAWRPSPAGGSVSIGPLGSGTLNFGIRGVSSTLASGVLALVPFRGRSAGLGDGESSSSRTAAPLGTNGAGAGGNGFGAGAPQMAGVSGYTGP